ncbi:hypothetical protein GGI23_001818, partial [Coemansia sp. RSA 2559]
MSTEYFAQVATYLPEYHVLVPSFVLILGVWLTVTVIQRSYVTPLWEIPGPLLNTLTNLLLEYHIAFGTYHQYTEKLHSTYGPVVRVGYNKVSLSDPSELKRILSTHEFPKGSFYKAMEAVFPSAFSTTDPDFNKRRRRQFGNAYSLPSVRHYEDNVLKHGVLSLIALWDRQITSSQCENKALVNFHYGFHGLAFDIFGILGFGQSFEILSTGDTKMIDSVGKFVKLGAVTSSVPFGNRLEWFLGDWIDAGKYVQATIDDTIKKRRQESAEASSINHVDILQRLVDARDPLTDEPIDDVPLRSEILTMLLAGTDTTSNTLIWAML